MMYELYIIGGREPWLVARRSGGVRAPGSIAAALFLVAACGASAPTPTPEPPASAAPDAELELGQTFWTYYDLDLERVVLVNGAKEAGPSKPTELWTWDGTAWALLDGAGPEARVFATVGRDPERGVVIVQGGMSSSGIEFDETLEWDGEAWSAPSSSGEGPGWREGAGFSWDPATQRMLLFSGGASGEHPPDTWTWSGTAWEHVADTGPRPRFVSLMTEDRSGDGGVLLQGGHWVDGNDGGFLADTWHWDGETWTEVAPGAGPGPRVNSPGAWDERLGGIVMFGGGEGPTDAGTDDTWLWTSADGWTQLETPVAPSPRNAHALTFDSKRQVLVLVGGIDRPGGTQRLDVWELGADGWREAMPPG
jgi:hypothetical protein